MKRWFDRAKEIAARKAAPGGKAFRAEAAGDVAHLYLYDQIGRDYWTGEGITAKDVVSALAGLSGAKQLVVHVNSPGGDVFEGHAIFNAIRSFAGEKRVEVDGIAASMASVIALAGDKVKTNEGAMWMVHDPWSGIYSVGTADDIEKDAAGVVKALRAIRANIVDLYAENTGRSRDEVSGWMADETWMTAAESLERGFCDEVAVMPPPDEEEPCPEEPAKKAARDRAFAAAISDTLRFRAIAAGAIHPSGASPGEAPRASLGHPHAAPPATPAKESK